MESGCVTFFGTQVRPEAINSLYWMLVAALSLVTVVALRNRIKGNLFSVIITSLFVLTAITIASFQPLLGEFKTHTPPHGLIK